MIKNKKSKKKVVTNWTIKTATSKDNTKPEESIVMLKDNTTKDSHAAPSKDNAITANNVIVDKDIVAQDAMPHKEPVENVTEAKANVKPVKSVEAQGSTKPLGKIALFIKCNRLAAIMIVVCFVLVTVGTTLGVVFGTSYELTSIEVESLPTKTEYIENQKIETEGLTVKAYYSNKKSALIENFSVEKKILKLGDNLITVTYTEKGVTKTTMFSVLAVKRSLTELKISNLPSKLSYFENAIFDPSGMIVSAVYNNGETTSITSYTYDKTEPLQTSDKSVIINYTENQVTLSAKIDINVIARNLSSIEITEPPTKINYLEGTTFDPTGIVVNAYFDNNEEQVVTGWDYDNKKPLKVTDTSITITYGDKSTTVEITVNPKILKSIMASSLPQKIVYIVEGEYFDFLGLEIYATYENSPMELITAWDYDKKEALITSDINVIISYSLHDITKTITVGIIVKNAPPAQDSEQEFIDKIANLLPPTADLTANDLQALDYALSLLSSASSLTPEQAALKSELETKRQEIINNIPPVPEAEYEITYAIANGYSFNDISYGDNPIKYKNSNGEVLLASASSVSATEQGYQFVGWILDGKTITKINNLTESITVYADFTLTNTVNIVFKDYSNGTELLRLDNIIRTAEYSFEDEGIESLIYSANTVLAVGYYDSNKTRISVIDLSFGATVTIFVKTTTARELHLANADSVTVGWVYSYTDDTGTQQVSKIPGVGTVFVVPIGATVTMISLNANISDILIDGENKGEQLNSSTVQAVFVLKVGEYPASVTFTTILSDIATISFVGYNQHSIVYPIGWNGYIAKVDLDTVKFVYDESSMLYITIYTIEGKDYYFEDLANYKFNGDTTILVKRVRNRFSLTIIYSNGTEKIDNLVGKQTLQTALNGLGSDALETVNSIFKEGKLYGDPELNTVITIEELLVQMLRGNIAIYSDWQRPLPKPPEPPTFENVDYSLYNFVGTWTSLFTRNGDVLSSELVLTSDGLYTYKTFINGAISANISGIYRIEADLVVLKTFILDYPYQLVKADDLMIDISFASDGLLRAIFIELKGTVMTCFEQTLVCGNVKPVNYTSDSFIGEYQSGDATIKLLANGTAVIIYQDVSTIVYYRVTEDNRLFIFDNGVFGTGEIVGLLGGNKK